jgi:hypothetical protein
MVPVIDELLNKYKKKEEGKEQSSSINKKNVTNSGGFNLSALLNKYTSGGITVQSKPGTISSSLVNDDYINTFIKDSQSYVKSYSSMLKNPSWNSITTSDNSKILSDRTADLTTRSREIRSHLKENRDLYDDETYEAVLSYLNNFSSSHRDINNAFREAQKYFSQWETKADYDAYVAYQKDYEEKSKFNLEAGEKEIAELEKERERIKKLVPNVGFSDTNFKAPGQKDSRLEAIDAEIAQKKQYLNQARHIQEGITLSGVIDNADFDVNSGYVSTKSEGFWDKLTSSYGMGYNDLTYEYINNQNGIRDEIKQKNRSYSADGGDGESTFEEKGYDLMTEDEISIYNYHYAKEGKEAAEKYLDSIQESLNYRKATGMYQNMEDKTLLELAFGVAAGLDQFESGIKSLVNTKDDYIPQTATQMASGMVRKDLADDGFKILGNSLGQVAYDAITTGANMAPSILTSVAVGMLNPVAGQWTGNALMGASAAGNAYQEALNEGYSKDQARGYSFLVGASEIVMEKLLGGISEFGGNALGKYLTKNIGNADTALKMIGKKLGGSMLSEFTEEYLQEVLTPVFQNLMLGTDNEVKLFSSEALYAGILGALTAGVMEGGGIVQGEVNVYTKGKELQNAGITAQRLAELGNTFAADTVAHQLAGRVTENTGAYTMGRLFNEIGAEITELNKSDIQKSLVRKGFSEKAAQKNAEIFATVVAGGQFTEFQQAVIESNDALAKTVSDVIINPNSTVNQRSQGYNEMLKSLADEMTSPNASRTNPAQQREENAPTFDTVDTQDKEGVQSLSEADAVDISPAKVQSISTIKDGQVTVKLEDGSEVNVKEADLDPNDGVRIETIAQIAGISSEDANYILGILKDSPSINARFDALGAKEVYNYGLFGISDKHLAHHGVFANSLTKVQRQAIYEVGQRARAQKAEAEQAVVAKNATADKNAAVGYKNTPTGKVHFEGDRSKLTDRQSASLTAMEKVADILGVQIHVFESEVNERGKRVGANGWYDPKDHSIHIDLHAGANGEGTMLFTAAHELTHFIREWSPAKFKTLADFLMQEYGKKGVNVDALVREQMAKAKRNGRTISYATAYEEVVADSMETMLADGKVMEKLAKLKAQDKSLWEKIKSFISELAAKIRAVYDGLAPDSVEGRYVAEMVDSIERLQDLFTEALVDASENYQGSLNPGEEGTVYDQSGDPVAHATSDGTIQLSMRTYEESGRKEFRKYLQKCVKNKRLTKAEMQEMLDGIEDIYMTCKEFKDKFAPFSSWSDAAVVRDTYGKPVFSVVTPNGDYKMNLDFSLVCKKRRTLDAVFNEMSRRGIIDDFELGQKSVVKINEIIRKYGLETACALCFVDAKRFRQASMADAFTSLYNELVLSLVPEEQRGSIDHFNFSGYSTIKKVEDGIHTWDASKLDFSHLDEVMRNYGDGTVEYKAAKYIKANAEGRKLLLRGDFMSSKGFDAVKTQNPDVLKLYNSKNGTGGPKAAFGDVQYLNEIIQKARTWTPQKAYAVGGIRIQSFSDYVPRMVFDYVQMIYDLAATKLPAHAYTKEALFVKQFGLTGVKINMSLIPAIAEGGIAPGLDANGNYVWAGESFDYDTAKDIQNAEGYSENCGTICVGVSYDHIVKLLRDPNIRMVIPYHKSGLNPIVAHMNKIAEFHDYTNDQRTKGADGKALEEDFDFSKALHDMGENASPKAVADQYLKWCAANGYKARFSEFATEENYYKLLEDFTLYDKDGNYVPQREVRAVFPKEGSAFGSMKDLIQEGLQEDAVIEGKRDSSLSSIVDEIQKALPRTEAEISEEQVEQADRDLEAEVKLSDRDSDGKTLTKDQQEFFKDSKARDKKGRLLTLYHGSDSRFTVYDTGKSDDKASIFLTDKRDVAQSYTYNRRDVDPYDEFDAHTASVEEVLDRYRQISPEDPLRAMTEEEMKSAQNTFDKGIENAMQKVGEMLTVFESTGYSRSFGYRNMKRMFDSIRNQTGNHIDAYYMKGIAENLGRIMDNDFPSARPAVEAAQEAVATIAEAAEILYETEHGIVLYRGENARGWDKYVADDRIRGSVNSAYRGGVIPLYANITNPFEVDAEGKNWNKVKTPAAMLSTGRYSTTVKTREISLFAKENGYDGVIIRNLYDLGGKVDVGKKKSTVLIAFDSNQIKSTANLNPTSDPDIRYSERVTDQDTLAFLNKQIEAGEYITVYRSFQVIDGGLYAPMNAVDRDDDGKNKRLGYRSEYGQWEMATESLPIAQRYMDSHPGAPYAKFDLDGVDNKTGGVAYNPYLHSSNVVLNDQFTAAYRRKLITVECRVPLSEANGAYKATYAKDGTGWAQWKAGGVAGQIKKQKSGFERKLFLSRYMLPVRQVPDAEVARMYKEYLEGTDIGVPWNVVTPSLRHELEKIGVPISYKPLKNKDKVTRFEDKFPDEASKAMYSDRDNESVSNRSLLANAFEGVAQNEIEKQKIQEYKGKIDLINAEERKLSKLNQKIKDLSFSKGPKDTKAIRYLQIEAKQTANRISTYDKQLLRMEASKPLQDVLQREKKMAYQRAEKKGKEALAAYRERATKTQQEMLERWQESRKKGIESREKTAMRHKIQHVVGELNNLLLSNDKKRHVPDSLKKAVADALALVNMDTVGAEERAAKYANLIANETDPDKIDAYTATMENILRQGEKMGQRLNELRDAYEEIQESDDPDIANAYDPVIAGCLKELSQSIGNTSLRNMTIEQMSDVYDMYRMVLTRVRDANKTLLDNIKESISNLASRVIGEVRMSGGEHKYRAAMLDPVRKFLWNNLKPVYAMEHIGSSTLTRVFDNVRSGEGTWAKDVTEARAYYLDKSKKYGYDSWDFKKKYRFQSASDLEFELTLEQILSLYAYSKREQAHDHLRLGGFVFDSNIETYKDKDSKLIKYKVNTADAHQITPEILADITGKLTKEQMGFVDEMQEYLSTVMGAKGNEVTMKMYGVKLFKEKFYFPLKSAKQFMFEQNEVAGEVRIKNSGFTNKVVAKANNPVILSNFMDVWSGHVNDMSMYHAFTLPLEDFNRVFNYNSPKAENTPPVSVKGTIQSAYSPAAVQYVKNLITDLNGGARTDPATDFINKMMGLFKKGSVFASLSVVVQQPSAIARAAALVDTKYFIGPKVDHKRHKALWDEVKQYAPVAIIKEMGYFDTNMGKSTQDFIQGKEYSGFQEKMKALVTDSNYRDEVLSKAPAMADELAWCSIWEAVKRETYAKHPGLDAKSEPFLMLAGSRFTEVIAKTQVYDSVLSRSALMRSKDTGMKMVTSFMGEPTTSINMIADALLQGKRGNRKYARSAIGAVIASQILNSILVSFVYAGRDDDEDKTYWEKYIGTLTGEVIDSLNPATYIPFIKDIVSITQGYDVERSDMAVISDLWSAWENLKKDNVSVYRKVEGFAGSIAQIFGLPVKNIMRDVRGIYQTIDSFMSGQQTTKAGIGYSVKSSLPKWMGGGDVANQNQLYEAILSRDQAQIARVKGRYKDEDAVNSAIRKALREHDPRIHQAAIAWNANDLDEYMRIAKQIISEKHFSQDNVVMAIRAEANALLPDEEISGTSKAKGLFTTEKFAEAIAQGDQATANAIRIDVIQTAQKNGKTSDEAEKSFNSSAKTDIKELFFAGRISEAKAIDTLVKYCGLEQADAEDDVSEWVFEDQHGFKYSDRGDAYKSGKISAYELKTILIDVGGKTEEEADLQIQIYDWEADGYDGATEAAVREYNEFCAAYDVPKDVYLHIRSFSNNTENDVDANGKTIYYSAMKKVMAEINAQTGLSSVQKTAIARSLGWSEKNIQKYKLW